MKLRHKYKWGTMSFMAGFHVIAFITVIWHFNWVGLSLGLIAWFFAAAFGTGIGFHRYLTHRGFKTSRGVERFILICGCLALQGGHVHWVAVHRIHHDETDEIGDPHSPGVGPMLRRFFWSHIGWMIVNQGWDVEEQMKKYATRLHRDKFHRRLNKWWWVPSLILGAIVFAIGGWWIMCWATFVPVVWQWHCTWLVNSACHMWGKRPHVTNDLSTNNWFVALLTFGEGWHNNHHKYQLSARHGLKAWEIDLNWILIKLLESKKWVWDIQLPPAPEPEPAT